MEFGKKVLRYLGSAIALLLVFGLLLSVILVTVITVFKQGIPDDDFNDLQVKTDHGVGVVEITGEILSSEKFEKHFKKLQESKKIKAIVVRIDSPGGAVGASEEMYRIIKSGRTVKPVVCSLGTVAASGGLFAAVGCEKILANESTLTGSIGVIMMTPNVKSLMEKFGVEMNVVKSGKLKDTGSPFREFTSDDREYLQSVIDRTYLQFIRVISDSRKIDLEKVKTFADGRVILGDQAKELGLIDEFGGVNEAAKLALSLTGDAAEPEVVRPDKSGGVLGMLQGVEESQIGYWWRTMGHPQLLYRAFF